MIAWRKVIQMHSTTGALVSTPSRCFKVKEYGLGDVGWEVEAAINCCATNGWGRASEDIRLN